MCSLDALYMHDDALASDGFGNLLAEFTQDDGNQEGDLEDGEWEEEAPDKRPYFSAEASEVTAFALRDALRDGRATVIPKKINNINLHPPVHSTLNYQYLAYILTPQVQLPMPATAPAAPFLGGAGPCGTIEPFIYFDFLVVMRMKDYGNITLLLSGTGDLDSAANSSYEYVYSKVASSRVVLRCSNSMCFMFQVCIWI